MRTYRYSKRNAFANRLTELQFDGYKLVSKGNSDICKHIAIYRKGSSEVKVLLYRSI